MAEQLIERLKSAQTSTLVTNILKNAKMEEWNENDKKKLLDFLIHTKDNSINKCWETTETIKKILKAFPPRVSYDVALAQPSTTGTIDPEDVFLPSYMTSQHVGIDYSRKIASGGQASIYNAIHLDTNTSVAVKIVDFEDQVLCSNYSSNLWRYLSENESNLDWKQKKNLIISCLECLQTLHTPSEDYPSGILHNDIKSENFLVTNDGIQVNELVLTDFGYADVREYQTYYNSVSSILGTVYDKQKDTLLYQAPEILTEDDEVPYSKRSDIFSLGRVIGEILTCKKPFHSVKNRNTLFKACCANGNDFTLPVDCPPLLSIVKCWCCATDVNDRPASCELVLDLLRKCDFNQNLEEVLKEKVKISNNPKRVRHRRKLP
ncbi:hypothetical protein C9374_002873 [Naegleria lovaniensis]|uniref:Protein kinase domain-containing protein n=1 Tax=Naegleria lovaniensis TaxID=51637 RepID=A0AA88KQG7_NAELO|nr:uncharacterized protein C9374_002873 [Naegleria lovaniensis]KAG2386427.1 hypothetical protein C9374_002873 [Naegleria lovaniensis]